MHELTASAIDNALGTLLNQQLLYLVRGTSSAMLGEDNWLLETSRRPLRIPLQGGIITYRGTLRTADSSRSLSVVVKLGRDEDTFDKLVRLGELYAHELFDERRPYVPLSYGAFRRRERTAVTPETRVVGCLVLEDCGKHLSSLSRDRRITDVFKVRLFNAFVKCHDAGVYRELDEDLSKHIFEVRGSPRLIGFTDAIRDHKCVKDGTTKRLPSFRGFMLEPEDFPRCDDIYSLGCILDLWVPNSFVIEGFEGQVFNVEEWLPKPIAIAELRPDWMSRTRGLSAVMESICQYLEEHFPPAGKEYRAMMNTSLGKWCELYEKHGPKLSNALNGVVTVPAPVAVAEA